MRAVNHCRSDLQVLEDVGFDDNGKLYRLVEVEEEEREERVMPDLDDYDEDVRCILFFELFILFPVVSNFPSN